MIIENEQIIKCMKDKIPSMRHRIDGQIMYLWSMMSNERKQEIMKADGTRNKPTRKIQSDIEQG